MILTEIGEIGVHFEGLELILSPSLYAMSKLGSPKEIVDIFHYVMNGSLAHSLAVIQLCADGDIREIFGYIDNNLMFNQMYASEGEIIIIAQSLMNHGIIGDIKRPKKPSKKDYTPEFHAKEYVAMAVAHLGILDREAWKLTMTAITGAMASKYRHIGEEKEELSDEDLKESASWFKSLDNVRKGGK